MTYSELTTAVEMCLRNLTMINCEDVVTDLDQYENTLQLGIEPTRDQLYVDICGMSMAGELGLITEESMQPAFAVYSEEQLVAVEESFGRIGYYVPGIVAVLLRTHTLNTVTEADVFEICIDVLAHERRHATQTLADHPSIVDAATAAVVQSVIYAATDDVVRAYMLLSFEEDAFIFSSAVCRGRASMADVYTFVPTQAALDTYRRQFMV